MDRNACLILLCAVLAGTTPASAQSPASGDSFADVVVTIPRSPDPRDFNGVWWPDRRVGGQASAPKLKPGMSTPAHQLGPTENNSIVKCMPAIRFNGIGSGMSEMYVQTAEQLTIISEEDHDIRQVYLNRPLPKNPKPSLTGYSVGHWDGNTLVIETVGLKDPDGTPQPTLRATERLRKAREGDYLVHTVTFEDPTRYLQPYTLEWAGKWRPDIHLAENICEEEYEDYAIENGKAGFSEAVQQKATGKTP